MPMLNFDDAKREIPAKVAKVFGPQATVVRFGRCVTANDKVIILVRGAGLNPNHYSTHVVYLGSGSWALNHGHYDLSEAEGHDDYARRVRGS